MTPETRMGVEELGAGGRQNEQRATHLFEHMLQQSKQRLLGPVQVLDQNHRRPLRRQLGEQLDPRVLEPVARQEGVQVAGQIQSERKSKHLAVAEPKADALRGIALADTHVLLEHLSSAQ